MSAQNSFFRNPWVTRLTVTAMGIVAVAEILYRVWGVEAASGVGRMAGIAVGIILIPRFGIREWALFTLSIVLTVLLMQEPNGDAVITEALNRGAFFGAFILLITLIREAAVTSPCVLGVGEYMTNQPPSRRFFTVATGGHIMGVLLNFGAISLLAPLIQRGVRADPIVTEEDERRAQIREQRQMTALIRGFCWMICWAPTALTQAVILASVPQADPLIVMGLGLGITVIMVLIGWAEERYTWRHINPRTIRYKVMDFPKRSFRDLTWVCLSLIVATYGAQVWFSVTTAIALMVVAPVMLVVWVFVQNLPDGVGAALASLPPRLNNITKTAMPLLTLNALLLGMAGFIGVAAAALAPVDLIVETLHIETIPAWYVLVGIPIIITLGGQLALSPILIVVFLAAVIAELPSLPTDPNYIAFALGTGWALSMTASPNATATLLISSVSRVKPTTLTWRWNGRYSIIAFLVLAVIYYILGHVIG